LLFPPGMNRWKLDLAADEREGSEPLRVSLAELMAQAAAKKAAQKQRKAED
jgi:hypothetical protein